jgi:starvation-inducible DNA-binding protein
MKTIKHQELLNILANYYSLYLKTQSYHWNITGIHFMSIHKLLEGDYEMLADHIDGVAERIRILAEKVPVSFKIFDQLSKISEPNENLDEKAMLQDLHNSNLQLIEMMRKAIDVYDQNKDIFTVDLLTGYILDRQKQLWFLTASLA